MNAKVQTYEVDDRGQFCRHCGKATWLHRFERVIGFICIPATSPTRANVEGGRADAAVIAP